MDAPDIAARVSRLLGGREVHRLQALQELWSGYGAIYRGALAGADPSTVIIKAVAPPTQSKHPRGWDSDRSHQRKLRSYAVERHWYLEHAPRCGAGCRVPRLLAESSSEAGWLFVFEDLDASGFSARRESASGEEIRACLRWLASFHATFLGREPEGLWPIGTYWHLDTRPDELAVMDDSPLRQAAAAIDARLNACRYQSFVHGDSKIANFCFPPRGGPVAAVDFQYVGGGCGMKDVAYFLSSCLSDAQLEAQADAYLDVYFEALRACGLSEPEHELEFGALEREWREAYIFAWADFHRFLAGWSPRHWKMGRYIRRMTDEALARL